MTTTGASHALRAAEVHEADTGLDVVTGAFSYSGRAIATELRRRGRRVRTMTGHPERGTQDETSDIRPLDFDDLPGMVASLSGATTLYNTYWVRFGHGRIDHQRAVENSRALFYAARRAGVQHVVHVSITNPSIESPYPYFRGKALVERALAETGIGYTILRPAILFGGDGVLINNIAWLLRHLPVFAVGGRGDYRIRAIHVQDLGEIAAAAGERRADAIIDAVGPERPTFLELVCSIRDAVGSRSPILRVPGAVVPVAAACLNLALRDVLLTKDEYRAMADNLADTSGPPTGHTLLSAWISENASTLGMTYANELERHFPAQTHHAPTGLLMRGQRPR
jgi:nucleoside-diphosphate-sugar epimerase